VDDTTSDNDNEGAESDEDEVMSKQADSEEQYCWKYQEEEGEQQHTSAR
jgi:hypothetical protein